MSQQDVCLAEGLKNSKTIEDNFSVLKVIV